MKPIYLFAALALITLPLCLPAQSHSHNSKARFAVRAGLVEGSWVSTSLSGDGIWLVVSTVGLDLKKDGSFVATAKMHGGGDKIIKGKYHLDIGKVRLVPIGMSPLTCTYSLNEGTMTLKNSQHGITVVLQRGQLQATQPSAPRPPGMHF